MAAVPTLLVLWLVWLPGVASVVLGFFRLGRHRRASTQRHWVGLENYKNIFTNYPPFQPAIEHNLIWLRRAVPRSRRRSACSWRCCWTRRSGAAGSTRRAVPAGRAVAGPGRLHVAAHLLAGPGPAQPDHRRHDRLVRRPEHQPLGRAGRRLLAADRLRHAALPGRPEGRRPDAARGRDGRRRLRDADLLPGRLPGDAADQHRRAGHHLHRVAARLRHRLGRQQGPQRARADLRPGHRRTSSARPAGSASARPWPRSCWSISSVFVALYLRIVLREEDNS